MPRAGGRGTWVCLTKIHREEAAAAGGATDPGSAEAERLAELETHVAVVPELRVDPVEPLVDRHRDPERDDEPGYQPGVVPQGFEREAQPLRADDGVRDLRPTSRHVLVPFSAL